MLKERNMRSRKAFDGPPVNAMTKYHDIRGRCGNEKLALRCPSSNFFCKSRGKMMYKRKGKERKGKERKGKERKGKERKGRGVVVFVAWCNGG